MNLLIVTQKVDQNDPILGFFHRWIVEFAKHWQNVTVICLEKGSFDLPANVKVISLGKETGIMLKRAGRRFLYIKNFYKAIWSERKNCDAVFVHMNPEYVVFGGLFWKLLGKKVSLWYTHKNVNLWLRIAEKFVDVVFTASKESFRLPSSKLLVTGHGIDTELFAPVVQMSPNDAQTIRLVSIGRIAETKHYDPMILAAKELISQGKKVLLTISGSPVYDADQQYEKSLKNLITSNQLTQVVTFTGPIQQAQIPARLSQSDIFLNLSSTGSLDKAVLEAMACGIQVLTSNGAFKNILPPDNFTDGSIEDMSSKIAKLSVQPANPQLRSYVVHNHSLRTLIAKLSENLHSPVKHV